MDICSEIVKNKPVGSVKNVKDFEKVVLYGIGNLGKRLYDDLSSMGIEIVALIDKNANAVSFHRKIFTLEEAQYEIDKNLPIILSGLFDKRTESCILGELQNIGFKYIYSLYQLDWKNLFDLSCGRTIFIGNYNIDNMLNDVEDISFAYRLFADDYDKRYFLRYVSAYFHKNFIGFSQPDYMLEDQYSGNDIAETIDYTRFMDCGAYDGDSLRNLIKKGKKIIDYVAFEPQRDLYEKIVKMQYDFGQNIAVIPCGVSDIAEQKRFLVEQQAKASGKVSENGTEVIQCMTIDMFGDTFKPTFIKMDIEGMEIAALKGAEKTIKKYKPSLAVCVYHDLSHLWKIPKMIYDMNHSYKFYLRNYQIMGLETVLYAIPED